LIVMDFQPVVNDDEHNNNNNNNADNDENDHVNELIDRVLGPIRERYPLLQGRMTQRWYDETLFFSKQMLFARFDGNGSSNNSNTHNEHDSSSAAAEKDPIETDIWPAFQETLDAYLEMVLTTTTTTTTINGDINKNTDCNAADNNTALSASLSALALQQHRAYDVYSAERDPALKLFQAKFGYEWADAYVHEFLFDQSRR